MAWTEILHYLASFVLVIALMVGLLFALRRLQAMQGLGMGLGRKQARLQVVESLPLGTRHKIALVRCDNREIVVAITAAQVTPLGDWQPAAPGSQG